MFTVRAQATAGTVCGMDIAALTEIEMPPRAAVVMLRTPARGRGRQMPVDAALQMQPVSLWITCGQGSPLPVAGRIQPLREFDFDADLKIWERLQRRSCYGHHHSAGRSCAGLGGFAPNRFSHQAGSRDSSCRLNPLGNGPGDAALAREDQGQVRVRNAYSPRKIRLWAIPFANERG